MDLSQKVDLALAEFTLGGGKGSQTRKKETIDCKTVKFEPLAGMLLSEIEDIWKFILKTKKRPQLLDDSYETLLRIQYAQEHFGVSLVKGSLHLSQLRDIGDDILVHDGFMKAPTHFFQGHRDAFSNYENMWRRGVFGNPDKQTPTYLKTRYASLCSNQLSLELEQGGYKIRVLVDEGVLLKHRSIYLDPESLHGRSRRFGDRVGDSYFLLGGIPKEAILGFQKIQSERWG